MALTIVATAWALVLASPPAPPSDAPLKERRLTLVSRCSVCPAFAPFTSARLDRFVDTVAASNTGLRDRALELRGRHRESVYALWGAATLTSFLLLGAAAAPRTGCYYNTGTHSQPCGRIDLALGSVGAAVASLVVGSTLYFIRRPSEPELVSLLNDWNAMNPGAVVRPEDL